MSIRYGRLKTKAIGFARRPAGRVNDKKSAGTTGRPGGSRPCECASHSRRACALQQWATSTSSVLPTPRARSSPSSPRAFARPAARPLVVDVGTRAARPSTPRQSPATRPIARRRDDRGTAVTAMAEAFAAFLPTRDRHRRHRRHRRRRRHLDRHRRPCARCPSASRSSWSRRSPPATSAPTSASPTSP